MAVISHSAAIFAIEPYPQVCYSASQLTRSIQLMAIVGRDQPNRNEGNGKEGAREIRAKWPKIDVAVKLIFSAFV
jgi:hypothetical protein